MPQMPTTSPSLTPISFTPGCSRVIGETMSGLIVWRDVVAYSGTRWAGCRRGIALFGKRQAQIFVFTFEM
jgi:hypothetical protein